jgi:PIN domain nuclease of toxin-antitoxin system
MTILFDSHAFVWFVSGPRPLPRAALDAIESAEGPNVVSAVTAWEVANKVRLGKWPEAARLVTRFDEIVADYEFRPLPISLAHARLAGSLPGEHRDPFDRMLAAQSAIEGLPLVTADPSFRTFGTRVIW